MCFTCCLAQSAWLWTPLHLRTLWEPQRSALHLCVFVPLIMLRKKRVLWATLGAGCRMPTPSEDDNSTAIFWANFFIGWAKTKWFFLTPARSWNQPRSIEKEQSGSSMPGRACSHIPVADGCGRQWESASIWMKLWLSRGVETWEWAARQMERRWNVAGQQSGT